MLLLSCEGLSVGYGRSTVLSDISCTLAPGELLAVLGHNGSGKSTFVKTLMNLQRAQGGEVRWPNGRPNPIAYLGQQTSFDAQFPICVRDLVAMGLWYQLGLSRRIDDALSARIDAALSRTGMTALADRQLDEISGGQLQRALFARTMVTDAQLIILDEPFAGIDQNTESDLLKLIAEWKREGRAIIAVLHDLSSALSVADNALLLGEGRARFGPPKQLLTRQNLVAQGYLSKDHADWLGALVDG